MININIDRMTGLKGTNEILLITRETEEKETMSSIVTARELGKYLKLFESTIYKLASCGELPGFKVGDSWRFDMEEVLRRLENRRKETIKREAI